MSRIVSALVYDPAFLDPDIPGLPLHGANLTISAQLQLFASDPRNEALEVFMPPAWIAQPDVLARVAGRVLPPERMGQGALRFYALHSLPEVWADAVPRILFCVDPQWMPRERYVRDRFAQGPMPISCDTHALGHHALWPYLERLARAPRVEFDSIVAISAAVVEALRRAFGGFLGAPDGRMPCRIDHLPHGVDADLFHPSDAARRRDARRLLKLPLDGQIALFLGRLTPNHKADLLPLLRVFGQTSGRSDVLLLAGQEGAPGYVARLEAEGAGLGLGPRLIVRTSVDPSARPLYFAAADLFVFPGDTVQESQANTVLEAMASGLPTVISDWDGMRDLVVHEKTGLLVPTFWMPADRRLSAISPVSTLPVDYLYQAQSLWVDTTALADALRTLLESPALRQAMGAAGRARVEAQYAWPRALDRLHALWDELTDAARRETPEQAAARRAYAGPLGLPTPFIDVFSHYATRTIDPDRDSVRLSDTGRQVVKGRATLRFYDETLPVLQRPVVDGLMQHLQCADRNWSVIGDLAHDIADETAVDEDDVRFHIALLLKRDMLELHAPTQEGS